MPLPAFEGKPVRVELRPTLGPHLAATYIRQRVILLDSEVLLHAGDFERIVVHELFHFAWVRCSNATRRKWEELLAQEVQGKTAGELGWSAEWRKLKLTRQDVLHRTPSWRRYACESFCDTAAWCYAGLTRHDEFTLPRAARAQRRKWFREYMGREPVSI